MDVTYVLLATCKCCTLSSCHSHRMRLKKFYIYFIVIAHNPVNNRGNIEWVEWEITIFVEVGLRSLERHVVLMTDGRTSILQRCCCCCWPHQAILSGCYWSAASVRRRVVDCRSVYGCSCCFHCCRSMQWRRPWCWSPLIQATRPRQPSTVSFITSSVVRCSIQCK